MHTEADWKKFKVMVPILRERYLAARNGPIAALLIDPKKNETERFWAAMEVMEKEAKVLRYCLDGHTRSKMWEYMLSMIHAGMLKKEDLAQFSDELQQELSYVRTATLPSTTCSSALRRMACSKKPAVPL